ncbi:MAG: DUF6527 family protein [Stellaceae bacterium]
MSQAGPFLRRVEGGYLFWCPGCGEMHIVRTDPGGGWTYNGDVNRPTFKPSIKVTGKQSIHDALGEWTGEYRRGPDGKALDSCCHSFVENGAIRFLNPLPAKRYRCRRSPII